MYTGTVQRNDDGSYTSSYGHTLTKGPDGQLYSGGAPIGLSAGDGGGVVPTAWGRSTETSSPASPAVGPVAVGVARASISAGRQAPSHDISAAALPIYVWMAALGVLAGVVVSGSPRIAPLGLHLHPVYGVAAVMLVVGGYRYMMSVLPSALAVSMATSLVWATAVWALRHPAEAKGVPPPARLGELPMAVTAVVIDAVRSTIGAPDVWVVITVAAAFVLHLMYWRHRRQMVKRVGWLFSRGVARAAKSVTMLAATAVALGMLFAWMG
jgi:hypothetical protein